LRILVLVDDWQAFTSKYLLQLSNSFDGEEVTILSIVGMPPQDSLPEPIEITTVTDSTYLLSSGSHRAYSSFFDFLASSNFDRIVIPRLRNPEFFILEIIARKIEGKFSIAFYGINEVLSSTVRRHVISQFLSRNLENKILIHSNSWWLGQSELGSIFPNSKSQIKIVADPIYDNPDLFILDKPQKGEGKETDKHYSVLFFGKLFFGKGLDLLLDAFSTLPKNIHLTIAGSGESINFDINVAEINRLPNVTHLNRHIPEEEAIKLFSESDLICLPYRSSYTHGTSGVLVQAALARKPVCVPDITPFRDVVEKYGVGFVFAVEDSEDLALKLEIASRTPIEASGWSEYLDELTSWEEIARAYTE
jgi:glycosyltransferase involved in cell wall biosynthesis